MDYVAVVAINSSFGTWLPGDFISGETLEEPLIKAWLKAGIIRKDEPEAVEEVPVKQEPEKATAPAPETATARTRVTPPKHVSGR